MILNVNSFNDLFFCEETMDLQARLPSCSGQLSLKVWLVRSGQGMGWDRNVPYLSLNPGLQFPSSPGTGLRACRRVMEEVARSPQLTPTPGVDTLVHLMRLSRVRPPQNLFQIEVFSNWVHCKFSFDITFFPTFFTILVSLIVLTWTTDFF